MKKAYLLLPILSLASCLGDDSNFQPTPNNGNNNGNPNPSTPVLITRVIVDGEKSDFIYNGSKISQIQHDNGEVSLFKYTGDLITEEKLIGGSVDTTIQYDYDGNGRLMKKIENHNVISGTTKTKIETNYTYTSNTNVKISYTRTTQGNFAGSPITTTGVRNTTLNTDGSLRSWTETSSMPIPNGTGFYSATGALQPIDYDTKNSPYKNITGYLKIVSDEDENGSTHNILNYNDVLEHNNGSGGASWTIFKSSYDYNTSGYATKNTRNYYDKTGVTITKTEVRTYEYNHL